jgi:dihydroorotate dehydrogenase
MIKNWQILGAGFLEIGTVTPQPQKQVSGGGVLRDVKNQALWNRLGFPSDGALKVLKRIKKNANINIPLFLNIGKNREVPLEESYKDYLYLLNLFRDNADAFVINISSPNTKGLRDLQSKKNLEQLLKPLNLSLHKTPVFLKLSPDLNDQELEDILEVGTENGIQGWILTNSTSHREAFLNFPLEGGVSGRPLQDLSKALLKKTIQRLGPRKKNNLVISVGGIQSSHDVLERLEMGADLIEVYSALIFSGPLFFRNVLRDLKAHDRII